MKISVELDKSMKKFLNVDMGKAVDKALTQATLIVQNTAKELAPYDTGTLRRSITSDFSQIRNGISIVGSPVPYAKIRHYINNLNPHTKRYLERGYTENHTKIQNLFKKVLSKELT